MKKLVVLFIMLASIIVLPSCGKNVLNYKKPAFWVLVVSVVAVVAIAVGLTANPISNDVVNPSVQEYILGQGNIVGDVDAEGYKQISPDFEIGADKNGIAVFKDPHKAFETFEQLYADGITYLQKEYDLPRLSQDSYDIYKTYGLQMSDGTEEQVSQGLFISRFLDIYENSFQKSPPNTEHTEPTIDGHGVGLLSEEKNISLADFEAIKIGTENDEIHENFGEPNHTLFGMNGDVYIVDGKQIIIYYGLEKEGSYPVTEVKISDYISKKLTHNQTVASALFSLSNQYLAGECTSEGHIILGYDDSDKNKTKIYALTTVGQYGFENDNFVQVSGSAFPAVIALNSDNTVSIQQPMDGSDYAKSIEKMFPKEYHNRVFDYEDSDRENLKQQEEKYAKEYLSKIGRDAKIGAYSDFEYTSLTDLGVSVEVSNNLEVFYKEHNYYPSFIGTRERIENDTRMVYEMSYHENQDEIRFTKYDYGTKQILEQFVADAKTGNVV